MKNSKLVFALMIFAMGSGFAIASGTMTIIDNGKGRCQIKVPSSWKEDKIFDQRLGQASSADKKSRAVVNFVELSFKDTKQIILSSLKPIKMIEDSSSKHHFEFSGIGAKPNSLNVYVAIPGKGGTCNTQFSVPKNQPDLAKSIVQSLSAK